jgi:glycerol-3-phosphate dehydrogenase
MMQDLDQPYDAVPYDVIVIGGGVNGAGVARDAAGRGARLLLLEQGDLASGTSSASTKLIHGGLRYLEHYEFSLVRESLSEREKLWGIAPHIIQPMRFILPHRAGLRPRWMLRAGLFLYDHIGGRHKWPTTNSVTLPRHPAGAPLQDQYVHGFEYSDGWVDDARLVMLNARDAALRGAKIRTHTHVLRITAVDGLWHVEASDDRGRTFLFKGRSLVNAAGPSVLEILHRAQAAPDHRMRLVRGSHIVVPSLFDHPYAYFFQLPDERIFFAIPYQEDFTLIGTTDADHHGTLDEVRASEEEIAYLCEGANLYFKAQISPEDVVWSYSGVRPLIDDGSGKPEAATRGYRLDVDTEKGPPLLTIYGGKITSYRHVAEKAVEELAGHLSGLSKQAWTSSRPLPGGDFPAGTVGDLITDYGRHHDFLPAQTVRRIAKAYGTDARRWLGRAQSWDDLGGEIAHGLSVAEVKWQMQEEWARTAEDVLWRRSKLGLRFSNDEVQKLQDIMASAKGETYG